MTCNIEGIEIPAKHSIWRHKNGNFYEVLIVSNLEAERQDEYPTTITYQRMIDGSAWSRPLSRWHGSFNRI